MSKLTFQDKQKTVNKRIKQLKNKPTKSELILKTKLDSLKYKYIFQKAFIQGDCYAIVDFYIPKPYKLCIEVDGGYHATADQASYDRWRDNYLQNIRGFKVLRLTNEQAEKLTSEDIRTLIRGCYTNV